MIITNLNLIPCPKRYQVILADPPWSYNDKSKNRGGAERHYETMLSRDIAGLHIEQIALPDSALFLWTTWPMLQDALWVMCEWGFKYTTLGFDWVKRNKKSNSFFWGMGHWTRSNSEICLLGIRGKPQRVDRGVHSVVYEPVMKHSEKPEEVHRRIERLFGNVPRIELFARREAKGWDCWGNEI